MCIHYSFGTCMESEVYGFESTCPLSNVSNKIECGDLHLLRYWTAIQECCLALKESKHWWAWFWEKEKKASVISLRLKHYVCKRIHYLTLSLHTMNAFGIHQLLVSGEDKEESRDLAWPAFPPAPKGVAVPGKENLTPLPKEALCLSAPGLCKPIALAAVQSRKLRGADAVPGLFSSV